HELGQIVGVHRAPVRRREERARGVVEDDLHHHDVREARGQREPRRASVLAHEDAYVAAGEDPPRCGGIALMSVQLAPRFVVLNTCGRRTPVWYPESDT